jgi:hypothetical protein
MLVRMKMNVVANTLAISMFVGCGVVGAQTNPAPAPRVFLVSAETLAAQRAKPDAELLRLARKEADSALKDVPVSVTSKEQTPPSGDKHDYMSMARYFWPNPDTPNHLPYIRKDGQMNPEIRDITDTVYLERMGRNSRALALGWYLTGDERYAEHAALMLRTWFLVPATAMNPNLEFAQYIPGVNTGRGAGILDARRLTYAMDAVGMLKGAKSWTAADNAGMQAWFAKYYAWLTTSDAGKHEKATPNNHGSWFAMQEAAIAMYLGKTDDVKTIATFVRDKRIPSQFDDKGMQKYELVRTNSFSYSAFNLEALTQLAVVVAPTGVDLYTTKPGILAGLDALMPYDKEHLWPHEQIGKGMENSLCPALVRAAAHTQAAKYTEAQERFGCVVTATSKLESLGAH